jgi:hypothetical protein
MDTPVNTLSCVLFEELCNMYDTIDYSFMNEPHNLVNEPYTDDNQTLEKLLRLYRSGYTKIEVFAPDIYMFHTQKGRFGIYVRDELLTQFAEQNNLRVEQCGLFEIKLIYVK